MEEVGLSFTTIHATPLFYCPWCGKLSRPIGHVVKNHDPVWECDSCKKVFRPTLRPVHHKTKIKRYSEDRPLLSAAKKVAQCFPDKIPKGKEVLEFNIPAYIIEELRGALRNL